MKYRKVVLIITSLIILIGISIKDARLIKAITIDDLVPQITSLQSQINQLKKQIAEIEKAVNSLAGAISQLTKKVAVTPQPEATVESIKKQISSVTESISQLTQELQKISPPPVTANLELTYKCPDINGDGLVDMNDIYIVSKGVNTCAGQANYDARGDVDGDNCLTNTDLNFVSKYFGRSLTDITQCKGVVKPESAYKCPDINGDGLVDMNDIYIVSKGVNTCAGQANYDARGDVDGDNCLTNTDLNFVSKYYGKNASDIAQCGGIAKYSLVLSVSGQGTVSPSPGTNTHNKGAVVTITATPASGWEFSYWQEADNNSINPTTVTMSSNKIVTAFFKLKTVPESAYKCPDINGDGLVDMNDIYIVSKGVNTCAGQTNYDARGDFDGDKCLTNTDLNFVSKYYGKNASDIAQCKTTSALKNMENMIASVANSIYQLAEQIKELFK